MEYFTTFGASCYSIDTLQLFQDVNSDSVTALLANCAVARVTAGQSVLDSGHKGTRLYVVLRGALRSSQTDAPAGLMDGNAATILPGECVGELSVLDDAANPSAIHALQETDLLVIEAEKLWHLIDESNGVARNLLRLLSFRVRAANVQMRRRHKVGEFYRQLSMVDGLTGLQNRAWLNDRLPGLVASAHADGAPLTMIMIDLDHFKRFNDEYGHLVGDNALRVGANVLGAALRPSDFAVRFGGEELMVILPDTPLKAGLMVAHRLCELMQQSIVFQDMRKPLPHITASFGVAALGPEQDADALIAAADTALYRAKEAGRNCVGI